MPLRYDEKASNILEVAKRISRNLEHFYLGAEHIALASLEVDGILRGAIASSGVDVDGLPDIVKATATPGDRSFSHQPETPRCKRVIKQAENVANYLDKGRLVAVEGSIQTGSYTDKDGNKRTSFDVRADRVEFLSSKGQGSESNDSSNEMFDAPSNDIDLEGDPYAEYGDSVSIDDNFLD